MHMYVFTVGAEDVDFSAVVSRSVFDRSVTWETRGIWNDEEETNVNIAVDLPSDSKAWMVAYALTVRYGQECVMVRRARTDRDDSPMGSRRRFFCELETTDTGNRTLFPGSDMGYRYVPSVKGDRVVFLVWNDLTVTPVV